MKTAEIFALCMIITIISFLGFVVENIWLAVTKGFIDNRNMCLPFLIGYGLAIIAIYLLFGTPANLAFLGKKIGIKNTFIKILLYFLAVMVCVSVGEIVLGTIVEKTCHIYWWDYTRLPMHITRYTSIPTSMAFSLMITVFMRRFFDPLMTWFLKMDFEDLRFTSLTFMTLMIVDFVYSAVRIYKEKAMKSIWKIDTKNTLGYRLIHS